MDRHLLVQLLFPLEGIKAEPHSQILQEFYQPNLGKWKLYLAYCISHAWRSLQVIIIQNMLP